MKPLFRWQTDEQSWEEDVLTGGMARSRRLALVIFVLFVVGGLLVYGRQIRQVAREEQRIEADVAAAYHTWQQAVAADDLDLFVHLLAGQDADWQQAQRALFLQGDLLDRQSLGLAVQTTPEGMAIHLSPDWQDAVVTYEQGYTAVTTPSTTALIRLQQTQYYQLDGSRWLQAPPDAEFWGESMRYDGQWLTLLYPARDAEWAQRLAADLDGELAVICTEKPCTASVNVRLETDPAALVDLPDMLTPVFNGRYHILPTFTLAGLPLDENSYQTLYQGYTRRIITAFQNSLALPVPLPDQDIQALCFPGGGNMPHLFRYNLTGDTWNVELPERAFRFLTPLPDDNGLILSDLPVSSDPSRLMLRLWRDGIESLLFDDTDPARQWRFPQVGWGGQVSPPHLLLHEFDTATQMRTLYHWLDLGKCDSAGCAVTDLSGYTLWSPDGRSTLIVIGSELWLGDEAGQPRQSLGTGFTPFWLDATTYGYTRYQPGLELVMATLDDGQPQVVLDGERVTAVLTDPATGTPSINTIITHPLWPGLLVLAGPEIRGAEGKYNIFTFQFDDWTKSPAGTLTLRLQLDEPPLGYPTLITPNGIPPVSFSPDGRWLVAAELSAPPDDTWQIRLHDLPANQTQLISTSSPRYPANAPFFDWSGDGQWLVLVDDGFFKLIAPAANYERVILHDFDACYFTAWVNP
ncbi:MAG: hypothetical protein H6667_17125 [Ardenticatenaceae bacterium]|nr:hypothetical protein [Ardenticatenaceae bacterium]MCB9443175.1 hypothetical protein [Ardenticatenaceae bacterium]